MTRDIHIGQLKMGGKNRILLQSMCTEDTADIKKTISQIEKLEACGCDIVRVAVLSEPSARAIKEIKKKIGIPIVADIHFNPNLALLAIENGADKIRINPGNISDKNALKRIIKTAKAKKCAIRIGINEGSLEEDLAKKYGPHSAKALSESALRWIKFFEAEGFKELVISVKSSDVRTMVESNRILSQKCDYPLHIGVTESGTVETGTIKSAIGVGALLLDGIGDTIRVSLAGDPTQEILIAKKILDALDIIKLPLRVIACPCCGRTKSDTNIMAQMLEKELNPKKPLTVAVLGCGVNFRGESKSADYAIVGVDKEHFSLFKKSKPIMKNASPKDIIKYLKTI